MAHLKTQKILQKELEEAQKRIIIGGTYSHYKQPENHYTVVALGVQEATDKLCVIYRAEYDEKLLFVRDVDSWLSKPEVDGKYVERFVYVKAI